MKRYGTASESTMLDEIGVSMKDRVPEIIQDIKNEFEILDKWSHAEMDPSKNKLYRLLLDEREKEIKTLKVKIIKLEEFVLEVNTKLRNDLYVWNNKILDIALKKLDSK